MLYIENGDAAVYLRVAAGELRGRIEESLVTHWWHGVAARVGHLGGDLREVGLFELVLIGMLFDIVLS